MGTVVEGAEKREKVRRGGNVGRMMECGGGRMVGDVRFNRGGRVDFI